MAFQYAKKRQNAPQQRLKSDGFPEGWNSLPNPSSLKDTELSELINGIYSQYGSISKRKGCQLLGEAIANSTKVINAGMFYKIGGEDYMLRITDTGQVERFNFDTHVWAILTGTAPAGYTGTDPEFVSDSPVFDTSVFINMVQANGKIYFSSAVDRIVVFDGTAWKVFIELADPTGYATVAKTGAGTGTRSYYYRWIDLNEFGYTAGSPAITGAQAQGTGWYGTMPVIDASTYLTITLPAAATGTTRRALYRGDVGGNEFFITNMESTQTVFVDKNFMNPEFGTDTPTSLVFTIPIENTTAGYHFYLLETYADSLVGTTVEEGRDVLVWSAGQGITMIGTTEIETFTSFALADGAGFDGYAKGDGQTINALTHFSIANEDGLAVFKDARLGLLKFDSQGGGNIQNVNTIRGTMSPLSPHIAGNNLRFYSSEGVASLGHEANYGTILRYTVMSLKADSLTKRVTPANLPKVCSAYYQNLSLFGISTGDAASGNNTVLMFDERYNTWSEWTGLKPAIFFKAIHPTTKVEELYFGNSITGDVVKMFQGKTDYASSTGSGVKITLSLTTKQYDAGLPDKFKKFDKVVLVFGALVGNGTTVQAFTMGRDGLESLPRLRISTDPTMSGFGNDEWGNQEIGMMTEETAGDTLNIRYINLRQRDYFWSKLNIQNDDIIGEITVLGVYFYYSASERMLPSKSRLSVLA